MAARDRQSDVPMASTRMSKEEPPADGEAVQEQRHTAMDDPSSKSRFVE